METPEPEPDDDDPISEEEDEEYEESGGSASDDDYVQDSEEETLMVHKAIKASHRTARFEAQQRSGAGPSTTGAASSSRATMRSVRIVESDEDIFDISAQSDFLDLSDLPPPEISDDENPPKTKGEAKAKGNKGKPKISAEPLTWAERTERRRLARRKRTETKREERLEAAKLGRNLTWVSMNFTNSTIAHSTHVF